MLIPKSCKNRLALLLPFATAVCQGLAADGFTIHVSPRGDDNHSGMEASPLRSLAAARELARTHAGKRPVEVILADGIYYLAEAFVLSPEDSGKPDALIVYRAQHEGKAVLSGGSLLELNWKSARGVGEGVFQAATPPGLEIDQLFVNGERQRMARYPDYNPNMLTAAYQGFSADAFSKERSAGWAHPAGGYIHAMHRSRWGGYHYRITGKNADGEVTFEGGWQNNRQMGMHDSFRMVENIFEELDAPGEWFHQQATNTLYYLPEGDTDLSKAKIEVVRLRHLMEFQGTGENPVRHITLKGFTYRHAARTFMDTKEPLLRSDWTIYRGGAVLLTGTEDISILDGTFDQVGGNAIFVNNYNRRVLIKGCHIVDAGASGVCFVGDPKSVRNPLFEYGATNDLTQIDRTPGPQTDNYPSDSVVDDCLIHGIGRVERQPAGVQISMASRITIRDTTVYDCARAGINISEGTWGGHLIERVDVFDTVLETHDHGSFNSWGRDRYWTRKHKSVSQPEIKKDPSLPFLDAVGTTIIRNSRWRCDHEWDIDLDDGSSNYEIYNNLMLAGGLKLREGYGRKAYNNILVNNGLHPHVWFEKSGDQFTRNIVMAAHAPIRQPMDWGNASDRNLFALEADLRISQEQGGDPNSVHGDPQFVDPAVGDFRINEGSPAFQIGFVNFPMDQFGVKKPSLKAMSKTPVIPSLLKSSPAEAAAKARRLSNWLGMALQTLEGDAFSAFGVSREEGGVQLIQISKRSEAAKKGFLPDDLVQNINGRSVRTVEDLLAEVAKAGSETLRVRIIRNQQPMEIVVRGEH